MVSLSIRPSPVFLGGPLQTQPFTGHVAGALAGPCLAAAAAPGRNRLAAERRASRDRVVWRVCSTAPSECGGSESSGDVEVKLLSAASEEGISVKGSERRTMQLSFTCSKCGARTARLVNPLALKKGSLYVQCSGCDVWHNLADHLNWMGDLYENLQGNPPPPRDADL